MHSNCINKLLNLKDVTVKKVEHADTWVKFYLETKPTEQTCPNCGSKTARIHDYRQQIIKDLPFQFKHTYLVLRKRRYHCSCGKNFYEHYSFLARYYHHTKRLRCKVYDLLRDTITLKLVARKTNLSVSTVSRILDDVSYSLNSTLPKVIAIDEFKGNTDAGKYQCILTDPKKSQILDIMPDRTQSHLSHYFRDIDKSERYKVQFFICDMWQPYVDLAHTYFPNATVVIDKYHFARQVTWAIENVRKRLQKTMPASLRKYYKRSHKLILGRYDNLKPQDRQFCDLMLLYNDDFRKAHHLKEWFYEISQSPKYSYQRTAFWEWIKEAESCEIPEFVKCAATFRHWSKGILNAFKYKYTNGPTEGYNNKIKVLKRVSYGVKNFKRFRTRILHSCS